MSGAAHSPRTAAPRITYLMPGAVDSHVGTQRYFVLAMSEVADVRVSPEPFYLRPARTPERKLRSAYVGSILRERSRLPFLRTTPESGATGRYVAELDGATVKFAIDARDGSGIYDTDALAWSDVFFKANCWPGVEYEPKVRPFINGNGRLDHERLDLLVSLRDRPKDIDVCFVSNIWGGREHNVRLFEALAKVRGSNVLRAVFTPGFPEDETRALQERLQRVGITCTAEQMPVLELWETMARSRIVFFRPGKHLCLPWRTLDLLAMGACVVMDAVPVPVWFEPLRRDVNFVPCMESRPDDTSPAAPEEYERIAPTVTALLQDEARMAAIRAGNAAYYDQHVAPQRLGEHILAELRAHLAAR